MAGKSASVPSAEMTRTRRSTGSICEVRAVPRGTPAKLVSLSGGVKGCKGGMQSAGTPGSRVLVDICVAQPLAFDDGVACAGVMLDVSTVPSRLTHAQSPKRHDRRSRKGFMVVSFPVTDQCVAVRGLRRRLRVQTGPWPPRETAVSAGDAVLPVVRKTCLSRFCLWPKGRGLMVVRAGCWAAATQNPGRRGEAMERAGIAIEGGPTALLPPP